MTTMTTVTCSVDETGRCDGFVVNDTDIEIDAFGSNLLGESVTLDDGRDGVVVKVYTHIQTRQYDANYVAVDIELID